MTAIEDLTRLLKKLPGMGEKSALRLAYHLIKTDQSFNRALGEKIATIQEKIHICPVCGSYTEHEICQFCADVNRDRSKLCIVEQPQDVVTISQAGVYDGLFHVLGGAINPLNGIGPDSISIKPMMKRIEEGEFREVIIATNPTEEGDTTALYIKRLLSSHDEITVSRLAAGLPIGGSLNYADKTTLMRSLRNRVKI